jgi:hypothetical protein
MAKSTYVNGLVAASFWLHKFESQIKNCKGKKNVSLQLLAADGRTTCFMLQALGKLYKELHNKKRFTKLKDNFKQDEDLLGQVDYWQWLATSLKANKLISAATKKYITEQLAKAVAAADKNFTSKYISSSKKIEKFTKKLGDAKWLSEAQETAAIKEFYQGEIEEINSFIEESLKNFTEVETQLHEIRRKIRWLSIYPHALKGKIQLKASAKTSKALASFITKKETTSSFNKLPAKGKNASCVMLHKNNFLAMSNVIAHLGVIKDKGLLFHGLTSAIAFAEKLGNEEAANKAAIALKVPIQLEFNILKEGAAVLTNAQKHGIVSKLL